MKKEEKGALAENRFLEVLWNTPRKEMPEWYRGVLSVSPRLDLHGVDAIAWVWREGELTMVPVQVKSSKAGADAHLAKRKDHWFFRVVMVVVNDSHSDDDIRKQLFSGLQDVVERGYDFHSFFREIQCARVRKKQLARIRARIRERERILAEHSRTSDR